MILINLHEGQEEVVMIRESRGNWDTIAVLVLLAILCVLLVLVLAAVYQIGQEIMLLDLDEVRLPISGRAA